MNTLNRSNCRAATLRVIFLLMLSISVTRGQQPPRQQPSNQSDEIVRITTELVQTDVTVIDQKGRFVDGLTPQQFELTLDGKPQAVSFFERVTAGSLKEAAQLRATRGVPAKSDLSGEGSSVQGPGRLIFFFLDDVHLSSESVVRARKALLNYIDHQMSQNDQVAIVSTSGQIGFLQQVTDNKAVLRTAIARLNYKRNTEYGGRTVISEYEANQVVEHNDRDLFNYLVSSTMNEYQLVSVKGGPKGIEDRAVKIVQNRARQIVAQSAAVAQDTLSVLESLMYSSSQWPGRKLVFFMSDGFITDTHNLSAFHTLQRVTSMAARIGAVFYTMDTRGTVSDGSVDAGRNDFPDGMASGTPARVPSREASALREPLHILANETGGRAIVESNSIDDGILQALRETSDYYLLAWRPENEEQRNGKSRLKVSIKGRPDLRVRIRSRFYSPRPAGAGAETSKTDRGTVGAPVGSAQPQSQPEVELLAALSSFHPHKQLPVSVSAGYVTGPGPGATLKISMQIERGAFNFDKESGAQKAEVDVIGAAIDDRGIISTFKQVVTVPPDAPAEQQGNPVIWQQQLSVPPGLYQVRVAMRERQTGRTGSAMQWIEIPDLSAGRLALSSLFLGERKVEQRREIVNENGPRAILVDVDHRFAPSSVLRFQTYVYNAARGGSAPEVWIQTQLFRDDRQVVALPARRVPTDASIDPARLPYWAELGLDQLRQADATAFAKELQTALIEQVPTVSPPEETVASKAAPPSLDATQPTLEARNAISPKSEPQQPKLEAPGIDSKTDPISLSRLGLAPSTTESARALGSKLWIVLGVSAIVAGLIVASVLGVFSSKTETTGTSTQGAASTSDTPSVATPESTGRRAGSIARNQMRMELVYVPAGSFMMGSPASEVQRSDAETPQHQVTIREGFYMGRYEVTQAQWQQVMGSNPSYFKGDNLPVEEVSWNDAQEFILKLNARGDGYTYRLPSEAEWEYACRAGTTTAFAFGDALSSEQANFDGNYPHAGAPKGVYRQKTTPVGSFQPNAFGLYDMHGNVFEWCEDWSHESYNGAPADGSAWSTGGEQKSRVVRGGSWLSSAYGVRSAERGRYSPDDRGNGVGFRVVAAARTL